MWWTAMKKNNNNKKVVPITADRRNPAAVRGLALKVSRVRSGIAVAIEPLGGGADTRPAREKGRSATMVDIAEYRGWAPVLQASNGKPKQ